MKIVVSLYVLNYELCIVKISKKMSKIKNKSNRSESLKKSKSWKNTRIGRDAGKLVMRVEVVAAESLK